MIAIAQTEINEDTIGVMAGFTIKLNNTFWDILPSSVPVPVPVKFNCTEIVILSLSGHHPPGKLN